LSDIVREILEKDKRRCKTKARLLLKAVQGSESKVVYSGSDVMPFPHNKVLAIVTYSSKL
jgi:hypothetical protein